MSVHAAAAAAAAAASAGQLLGHIASPQNSFTTGAGGAGSTKRDDAAAGQSTERGLCSIPL